MAGAAVGSLLAAAAAAAGLWLLLRYRRARARQSDYLTSTASFADVGRNLRDGTSRDEEAPPPAREARPMPYDEEDEYSAHDFI